MKRRAKQRGSTLIDICAACVMGSTTMALALPSYQSYLEYTSRADAVAALERVQDAQMLHFERNGSYAMQLGQLDSKMPAVSNRGLYQIEMFAESPDSFEVHANAVPGREQAKDPDCAQITLRVTHGAVAYEPLARCWNR